MKDVDILKDMLQQKITNQIYYNENLIQVRNPELRQLFMQLRDDEFRAVAKLQQKIERIESNPGILAKIFPVKDRY